MATCLCLYPKHDVASLAKAIFLVHSTTDRLIDRSLALAFARVEYPHYYARVRSEPCETLKLLHVPQNILNREWLAFMTDIPV